LPSKESSTSTVSEVLCVVCPLGCRLTVGREGEEFSIRGGCSRGKAYARQEVTHPCRVVTTTVRVRGGEIPRLPVRTSRPFPKDRIFELMGFLHSLEVEAPVTRGEVILRNLLGEDIDLVATRTIRRLSEPQEDSKEV
jgi:CxxC motif-containing protein